MLALVIWLPALLYAERRTKQAVCRNDPGEPQHFSDRAPWLRAAVLGANDGLVSVSSIMLGVGAGSSDRHTLLLSGLSALVAGEPASHSVLPLP